jgi:hypothetical protein
MKRFLFALAAILIVAPPAHAHVGNKDVYQTVTAGPYKLFITIRTPLVIPGVATIEVRSTGASLTGLTITPLMLTGDASRHPPTPDAMQQSKDDPSFYTGSLWLMSQGSWQVRFGLSGAAGPMAASVPVPAMATAALTMDRSMAMLLGILGLILTVGVVGIVMAAIGESRLTPGVRPDAKRKRTAAIAGAVALCLTILAVYFGGKWWNVEAATFVRRMHRNSVMHVALNGDKLTLDLGDPDPRNPKVWDHVKITDLLPDHGHLMHLYAIRTPQMDAAYHLHPAPDGDINLSTTLPAMPPGTYKLFADVVFANGFPETETATLTIPPGLAAVPLAPEDASAAPPPLSAGELGPSYKLPDGYTMAFDHPADLTANTPYILRFQLLDPSGKPAQDMQPYLGMAGHAAFIKTDLTTFAHTHPDGSAAMPAVMLADASTAAATGAPAMAMPAEPVTSTVEFPYGFPSAGRYRIFIQMKHAGTVETGVFDVDIH